MPISVNLFGRILGVVKSMHGLLYKLREFVTTFVLGMAGPIAAIISTSLFTLVWWLMDDFLEAQIVLNSAFDDALGGAVTSNAIIDILQKANYYFPIDTLGALSTLYCSIWSGLAIYRGAKELMSDVKNVVGLVK